MTVVKCSNCVENMFVKLIRDISINVMSSFNFKFSIMFDCRKSTNIIVLFVISWGGKIVEKNFENCVRGDMIILTRKIKI